MKTTLTMKKRTSLTNGAKRIMRADKENMSKKIDSAVVMLTLPMFIMLILDFFNLNNFGYETLIVILNNIAFIYWNN